MTRDRLDDMDPAHHLAPSVPRSLGDLPGGGALHHSTGHAGAPDRPEPLGDGQLVVGVAQGDDRSLAELYRRHGRSVYGLAKRVAGDGAEAEDLTQEVFVHLWENPGRFDPDRGTLRTYLLTRAHSRAVDLVRSRSARRQREEKDARSVATATYDLEREAWDLALAERVADAVAALPAAERAAIELAYFDGHTYREVADLLSEPEGTVKSRIRRGLQRLRDALDKVERHDRGS